MSAEERNHVHLGDNLPILRSLPDQSAQLIYIDPPYNTGRQQKMRRVRAERDPDGEQRGFGEHRYRLSVRSELSWTDQYPDLPAFLEPRLREAHRLLDESGTLYVHLDWREVHYIKVLLDEIFDRQNFLNEIIWAYDYGARSKRRWPTKHDTILVYVKDRRRYHFDSEAVDRIPFMAPGLVSKDKARRGKLPTDTWWHTIVPTNGRERTGYPTQKPMGILRRIIAASSRPGDHVIDFFAGSGTTGAVCHELGRRFTLIDASPDAIDVMRERLHDADIDWHVETR